MGICKWFDINSFIANIGRHIYILDKSLEDNPFLLLFNKVTLGYLYYQFLIAIRKNTRK